VKLLRLVVPFIFVLPAVPTLGQQAIGKQAPVLCRLDSLPPAIQRHLREEYGSWRVQEAANLSPRARGRWESEKPLGCPGMAVGHFESAQTLAYALLLVPVGHADAGYMFVVFSQKAGQSGFEGRTLGSMKAERRIILFAECQSASFSMNCRKRDSTRITRMSFCFLTQLRRNTKSKSIIGPKIVTDMTPWTIKSQGSESSPTCGIPATIWPGGRVLRSSTRAHHSFPSVRASVCKLSRNLVPLLVHTRL